MSKSKNNFRDANAKANSQFKLWICYKKSALFQFKGLKEKMTYYGYMTKKDGGLKKLKEIVDNRFLHIKIAILYDNKTNTELMRWDNSKNNDFKNN